MSETKTVEISGEVRCRYTVEVQMTDEQQAKFEADTLNNFTRMDAIMDWVGWDEVYPHDADCDLIRIKGGQ